MSNLQPTRTSPNKSSTPCFRCRETNRASALSMRKGSYAKERQRVRGMMERHESPCDYIKSFSETD